MALAVVSWLATVRGEGGVLVVGAREARREVESAVVKGLMGGALQRQEVSRSFYRRAVVR